MRHLRTLKFAAALLVLLWLGSKCIEYIRSPPTRPSIDKANTTPVKITPDKNIKTLVSNIEIPTSLDDVPMITYHGVANAIHIYSQLSTKSELKDSSVDKKLALKFESKLFPFMDIRSDIASGRQVGDGSRGIVMAAGNKQHKFAMHFIKSLREVHKSELLVEIYYNGPSDLDDKSKAQLLELKGVAVIDIKTLTNWDLSGYAIKPFCVLFTKFSEVILVDADTLFIQSPEVIFNYKEFVDLGTFFFKDREIHSGGATGVHGFTNSIIKNPSAALRASSFWKVLTKEHQEAGVVAFDKRKNDVYFGLLAVCRLNTVHKNELYGTFNGDKETYWIAFELMGYPYHMQDYDGAAIGTKVDDLPNNENGDEEISPAVCGHILHVDAERKPLWWNGGILKDKYTSTTVMGDFKFYGYVDMVKANENDSHSRWSNINGYGTCLKIYSGSGKMILLSKKTRESIQQFENIWNGMSEIPFVF